jgi:hypothetical protein
MLAEQGHKLKTESHLLTRRQVTYSEIANKRKNKAIDLKTQFVRC